MSKTTFTMFVTFLVLVLVGVTTTYIIYKYVDPRIRGEDDEWNSLVQ